MLRSTASCSRASCASEWGFDGVVISDWGAVDDRVAGPRGRARPRDARLRADNDTALARAVAGGRLAGGRARPVGGAAAHARRAHRAAPARTATSTTRTPTTRSPVARPPRPTVLLKNDGGLLPLAPGADVAVVGAFAAEPRYQGAGSSGVNPHRLDDAPHGARRPAVRARLRPPRRGARPGAARRGRRGRARPRRRRRLRGADRGLRDRGLRPRRTSRLPPAHDALVEAVAAVNDHVVVVLANGAPVELPWRDRVAAIVEGYLGGQAGGSAIADVLIGAAEPGGRLAETFPARWEDHPLHGVPIGPRVSEYRESVYVGYRLAGADEAFPFGHGLSLHDVLLVGARGRRRVGRRRRRARGDRAAHRDQHGRPRRLRRRAALRPRPRVDGLPAGARAARVREGAPRARRIRGGRPRARPPRVRVLGPGPPRLGGRARGVRAPRRRLGARHPLRPRRWR